MEDTIIRTKGLTKRYGTITAVDHLDLSVARGEVFGLLGPNGAGKTTTTLMLLGLTEPTSGSAHIDCYDCTREPAKVKSLVGYLPDSIGFYPNLTGRENLCFTGALNGLDRDECLRRADQLLNRVGMTYAADRKTGGYSRGMKQRLGIADVLMKDPAVIILDEPTLGIDPEGIRELIALIRELSVQDGRTVLISSHQLYQVQQICDRVGIFVAGELIACGPIEALGKQLQNEGLYILDLQVEGGDAQLHDLLRAIEGVSTISQDADGLIHVESDRDIRHEVSTLLFQEGYPLLQFRQRGGDLDEIYRKFFEKAGEHDAPERTGGAGHRLRSLLRGKVRNQE
mgnify:CR=1 FL=1